MNFIRKEIDPLKLTINGMEYPTIWNFKAISIMEEYTGLMHLYTLARFKEGRFEPKEVIGFLVGALQAAGVECLDAAGNDVLPDALLQSISPKDEKDIIEQIKNIIAIQGDQPKENDAKNAVRSAKKI